MLTLLTKYKSCKKWPAEPFIICLSMLTWTNTLKIAKFSNSKVLKFQNISLNVQNLCVQNCMCSTLHNNSIAQNITRKNQKCVQIAKVLKFGTKASDSRTSDSFIVFMNNLRNQKLSLYWPHHKCIVCFCYMLHALLPTLGQYSLDLTLMYTFKCLNALEAVI